jgi:glycopeptide antibiotics resistance protein
MKKEKKRPHPLAVILFVMYICLLFYLLFFSETYGRTMDSGYRYNLKPFKEIKRFWNNRDSLGFSTVITNLIGNIVAFAPFGFFLPMFFKIGRNLFGCVFFSALFSLAVEAVQFFTKVGAFDVDDILLNAIGGFVGWLCYFIIWNPLTKKKIKRKKR